MSDKQFDLVVIGGGPGGYVAAIRAAQLGLKTALVEAKHLGGICLNWGCIPTKALLKTSEIYQSLHHLEEFGLAADNVRFDLSKVIERSRQVAQQLASGIKHLLKKNKVTVFEGWGTLTSPKDISVQTGDKTEMLKAKNIILATGARPRQLPNIEADGHLIWTSKEAMTPTLLPKKLLIIGSGAIGIEFANFYNAMGTEVTVIEIQDRILPVEDHEISQLAQKQFEKAGININTNSSIESLQKNKDNIEVTLKTPKGSVKEKFDRIILAVGIVGNTENIGLEKTKINVEKNQIVTNEFCETNESGIYAIGDVTAGPWLAHKASHEGILAVEKMAGKKVHPIKKNLIPGCTYSSPQIASIGMTEQGAKEKNIKIKVGRFPFMANGKAIASGKSEGLVKTIFDEKTGELLGAHMIGADVTELIQGYAVAMTMEGTEEDLMHTVFPHPTLSEMMHESVLDAFGRAIHF